MSLSLREVKESDLEMVMRWRMLPEITRFMYTDPKLTISDQERWLLKLSTSQTDIAWIIELDAETPVGLLSLSEIDFINERCFWAYYIAEDAGKGKGLAKPLECNICDFVFDMLNLEKLCCEVFCENDRVIALHKKFGSEVEGVFRMHIRKGSEVFDVARMGLLRGDWEQLRQSLNYQIISIDLPARLKR